MENQESVNTNDEFPAGPKTGRREQARRSNYWDMTIGETMDYLHSWLYRTCPVCDKTRIGMAPHMDFRFSWCCHHRPAMQLRGDRGITLSFEQITPSLRMLGLMPNKLHSGLRDLAERVHDVDMNQVQNFYLELDTEHARAAAGYDPMASDSESDEWLEMRENERNNTPSRDTHSEFEVDGETRRRDENETCRILRVLDLVLGKGPIDCPNCGRHVLTIAYNTRGLPQRVHGNHLMLCKCCKGPVCMNCANNCEDPLNPTCFPCQYRWQATWVTKLSKFSALKLARIDELLNSTLMARKMYGLTLTTRMTGESDERLTSPDMTNHVWLTNHAIMAPAVPTENTPPTTSQPATASETATQMANAQGLFDFSAVQTW